MVQIPDTHEDIRVPRVMASQDQELGAESQLDPTSLGHFTGKEGGLIALSLSSNSRLHS